MSPNTPSAPTDAASRRAAEPTIVYPADDENDDDEDEDDEDEDE
jgi:hypothetical protein